MLGLWGWFVVRRIGAPLAKHARQLLCLPGASGCHGDVPIIGHCARDRNQVICKLTGAVFLSEEADKREKSGGLFAIFSRLLQFRFVPQLLLTLFGVALEVVKKSLPALLLIFKWVFVFSLKRLNDLYAIGSRREGGFYMTFVTQIIFNQLV